MANFNFNRVILGGRLTADPELKQTNNGTPVCTFSIAVNRRFAPDQVDFINCQAWKKAAEFLCQYFRKGSSLCIVGSVQTRSWTDQGGQKRYATEIVADEINFVDSKADNQQSGQAQPGPYGQTPPAFSEMSSDDDIPF